MKRLFLIFFCTFALPSFGSICETKGPNVILLTFDGVRSREFFKGTGPLYAHKLPEKQRGRIFKKFWSKYAQQGIILGKNRRYKINSDVAVSLPSYQALMTGHSTGCRKNDSSCPNIKDPSVLESVRSNLNLPKKDVAIFASWNRMIAAAASDPSTISHGIYPEIFNDGSSDPVMKKIQREAMADLPKWDGSRKDKYTFALGMHYLKMHCPRFLYISLVDSDEFGHMYDYPGYVSSLSTYDNYLDDVITTLKNMGGYGANTSLIVTTDHSRGAGPLWFTHAITPFSEKKVFLYAYGRKIKKGGVSKAKGSHAQVKATIEHLMGVQPSGRILPIVELN